MEYTYASSFNFLPSFLFIDATNYRAAEPEVQRLKCLIDPPLLFRKEEPDISSLFLVTYLEERVSTPSPDHYSGFEEF